MVFSKPLNDASCIVNFSSKIIIFQKHILKIIIKYTTFDFLKLNFMKIAKSIILAGFLCTSIANYGQFTDQINSNRPGKSAGAFSVGKNVFQSSPALWTPLFSSR